MSTDDHAKPQPPTDAEVHRALDALDWAAGRAERGDNQGGAPEVSKAAFRAAAARFRPDVRARLDRVMMASDAEAGLDAMLECGALVALLPSVEKMVGFSDGEWRHKDVWKHTKQVVSQAVPRIEVRWAALLHDIGKVKTRTITPNGQVHFHGHAEVGARMFDSMERRMPLFVDDEALKKSVRFLIYHHLRASQYDKGWTSSAVRRFAREMGEHMEDLFCLSRADITTKRPERKRRGLRQINELAQRVSSLAALDEEARPVLPKGLGNALMSELGIPPSKRLGDVRQALEMAVRSGTLPPNAPTSIYLEYLRERPYLLTDS